MIWENVPGALSSNGGKDFETVLNELLRIRGFAGGRADKPILQHGKWGGFANYGAVAYRIVNAQYWGIPQRRRRVYVYAPNFTIYGSMNAEDLRSVMDEGYEKFCEYVERYEREKRRTQYGT